MEFKFAKRVENAALSAIRVIGEYAVGKPDFVLLSIGNPAYESFPIERIKEMNMKIFESPESCRAALQYGSTTGTDALRDHLKARLAKYKGIDFEKNDVFITSGSGPALDLMPQTFCEEEDCAFVEEFTYTGELLALSTARVKPIGIKLDSDGMNLEDLEAKIKANPKGKYLYIVPTFSNPTGITYPLEKRKAIYEICQKYDLLIYEDDPYGELRFQGKDVPCMKSFDTDGRVIYAGSFSKVMAAGLRVGFICCDKGCFGKMNYCQGNRAPATVTSQMIISNYMDTYDWEAHLDAIRAIYGKKAAFMKECIDKYVHPACTRTDPDGGMFIWVTLPEGVDGKEVFEACLKNNVGVVPSFGFAADPVNNPGRSFRLNYSAPTMEDIEKGCKRFGEVTHKFCK
ncbi:2-aminoadipate transaminase [bioreactor metagenome]|uniref:2-aminoadipate transaminase n=1 Tax=bioreactor metagenome TaxID=1076179 RepID=A0A644WSH2_9ZZZZ